MINLRRNRYHHPGEWLECRYLSPWLDVAARGLSDESKARVREEIGAHFHDAVDDGRRTALSDEASAERAVRSLGSAKSARRAFRHTYLTRWEESCIREFHTPNATYVFGLIVLFFAGVLMFDPRFGDDKWAIRTIGVLGSLALWPILAVTVPKLYGSGYERRAVMIGGATSTVFYACYILAGTGNPSYLLLFAPIQALALLTYARVIRKLRNHRPHHA